MRYDRIVRKIVLLLIVAVLLFPMQSRASNTEDYQYLKEVIPIIKSCANNDEKLNNLMMSLAFSSLTGGQGSKNELLKKINRIKSESREDFETLSKLNPSYKYINVHTYMLDLVTSFHFMVQVCEKLIENIDLEKTSSLAEIEEKIVTPYKQMKVLINRKIDIALREIKSVT